MSLDYGIVWALLGVAISVGLGSIASAKGIGNVASTASGLLSKQPKAFGQALVLSALPSTQSLYGMLFGFIILIKVGLLAGDPLAITHEQGWMFAASSLPVGIACYIAGIWQGKVGAAGVKILAEQPKNGSQAIILAALVETIAIFGFVVSLLIAFVGINVENVQTIAELAG